MTTTSDTIEFWTRNASRKGYLMNTLTHTTLGATHTYEIVDDVPCGYTIWNIGKNAPKGYLPLCRLTRQFEGGREIEPDTLKAIKADGAEEILSAVGFGPTTLPEMERYVKRYGRSKTPYVKSRVERCRKAIYYMQKIKGIENLTN